MKTLILALALCASNAFAWGPTGHRVVGDVAQNHLSPAVAYRVTEILKGMSMSRVSNWPDEIKSEPETHSHTYNWHYTDWKDSDHDHDESQSSGKLIGSLRDHIKVLNDASATDSAKAYALKFVIHLIGDLHQPLHVGNGLDQGGNKCKVTFHKKEMNLHALWDEGMIDFTNLSYTELSDYVSQGRTAEETATYAKGDLLDWAIESKELRNKIYPANVRQSEAPMSIMQYCRSDIIVAQEDMPKLAYEYSYKFVPVVELRLYQAGVRLAAVLNEYLK